MVGDDDACSPGGQLQREASADAATGAGNHNDAAVEA
jgi:hypothetical protein